MNEMIAWTIEEIITATGGRTDPLAGKGATVRGISTDSRTLRPGNLFIPLRGPHFDGHDYLSQAVSRGAAASLTEEVVSGLPIPVIQVPDTLIALGDMAAACRRRFDAPVVGVTGSVGKTTTKEMLSNILALSRPGLKSAGNFNNLVGLPKSLLELNQQHHWAVLEMGMSRRGEIARLTEIAAPTVGILTNIGPAHLEELQDLAGVARAKGELFANLPPGGTAVINGDDPWAAGLPVANGVRRLLFGMDANAQVRAENVSVEAEGCRFRLVLPAGAWTLRLPLAGRHNVINALAAAAGAWALNIPGEQIVAGLQNCTPSRGRLEQIPLGNGVLLLEDTYNANPLSVAAALQTLAELAGGGKRIAVIGDMLELGAAAAEWHREIGLEVARRADFLIALGDHAADLVGGARAGGMPSGHARKVAGHEQAVAQLSSWIEPGARILVKGSRGMTMEKVTAILAELWPAEAVGQG